MIRTDKFLVVIIQAILYSLRPLHFRASVRMAVVQKCLAVKGIQKAIYVLVGSESPREFRSAALPAMPFRRAKTWQMTYEYEEM